MGKSTPKGRSETATIASPSYANELITEGPARKIRDELYHRTGFDAIWRLSNAGFVTALAARNYQIPNTDVVILNAGGKFVLV